MTKVGRGRASHVSIGGPQVRIADRTVCLSDYARILDDQRAHVIARLLARQQVTDKDRKHAAKALTCGRFIAATPATPPVFERVNYCREPRMCRCCYALYARGKAEELVDDITKNKGMKLLHIVFSPPRPKDDAEAQRLLTLTATARLSLRSVIAEWARRKGDHYSVGSYAIGIHVQRDDSTPLYWAHVHIAILVHRQCPVSGYGGIEQYLRHAYEHAVDDSAVVKSRNLGVVQYTQYSPKARQRKHRAKTCSYEHARNTFAYIVRNDDDEDTPDITAGRDQLLASAGIRTTYTRSRSTTSHRRHMPHHYSAEALGKQHLLVYPLDDPDASYRPIDPARETATVKHQLALAQQLVQDLTTDHFPVTY